MVESEAHELPEDVMLGARRVRPRADAGGDRADPRARRRRRQAGVGLAAAGEGRGADRARRASSPRRDLREAYRIKQKQARSAGARRDLRSASLEARRRSTQTPDRRATSVKDICFDLEVEDRAQPDPRRRAAHRRPRHAHRAPDHHPHRRAAAHARLGAVHARRDAGAGRRHARHRRATSRSSTR